MREELARLARWQREGDRFALAVVTETSSSAPRRPGAVLGRHPSGEVVGSVSGGCVEADVAEVADEVLASGRPQRRHYGIADADAIAVGLTCGGTIDVFVGEVGPDTVDLSALLADVEAGRPVALATVVDGPEGAPVGRVLRVGGREPAEPTRSRLEEAVVEAAHGRLAQGVTELLRVGPDGERLGDEVAVLVQSFAPPPHMLVFGATDFARATAAMGSYLGYRVTVCDARETFATPERFPEADEVVVAWPHRHLAATEVDERTVICVLTHDPKFDVPLLEAALATDAAYIGAMGSRRTDRDRRERLRERGVGEAALARLRSPIGLDLGAVTPQETAVSIASEIVLLHQGGTGRPLRDLDGAIHRTPDPRAAVGTVHG